MLKITNLHVTVDAKPILKGVNLTMAAIGDQYVL